MSHLWFERVQERANLAEQTLRQKEALLAEKERFQSEVQHFSQVRAACQRSSIQQALHRACASSLLLPDFPW